MAVQFNLLPDVKLQYIRATHQKRLIILVSSILSLVFIMVFVFLFLFVRVNQTKHLSNLDKDIENKVTELKSKEDIEKVLTVQNQLASLPSLHGDKYAGSRLFDYLSQLTPIDAQINDVDVDFEQKIIALKGEAKDIVTINKFVDTLKFTEFKKEGDAPKDGKAFSSVVLKTFSLGEGANKSGASFEVQASFDDAIFMNTAEAGNPTANKVTLTVPNITSTRSQTQSAVGGGQQ